MTELADDGGHGAPRPPVHFRSGGLRKKLLRSFLGLTVFGLVLLFTSLISIFWLRTSTNRLAFQQAPGVEAALQARIGIQRSLAGLRGWVALGRREFREERRAAWVEDIEPAIARLHDLSQDWTDAEDQERLAGLDPLLADLKESQWWVEDVAQTEGNESARVILRKKVEPIARKMLSTIGAMIDSGDIRQITDEQNTILAQLSGLQIAHMSSDYMLSNFVILGEGWLEAGFHQNLVVASKALEQIAANAGVLSKYQQSLLVNLQQELPWHAKYAAETIKARSSDRWNAAQYLMTTETVPLSEDVIARLNALSINQIRAMQGETAYVNTIGRGAVFVSIGLIVAMAIIAGLMSNSRARQITQPLSKLSEATRELVEGRLKGDLPVTTDDELGSLTHAFNQMRAALQKSGAALKESYEALAVEHDRAETLLLNILPPSIAERLKKHEGIIADEFADVTVLFADIVGFTQLSSAIPAEELVRLLDDVFSRFDSLVEAHGLEKIKTLGDAYMLAGGLPMPRPNHAEAVAEAALGMLKEIASFNAHHETSIRIRVGMNSGPVVAGVIGRKKFIYDIWGDTVNIASRMESTGLAGSIQVSEGCYQRLRSTYVFEDRGIIQVKGQGEMRTYLLKRRGR
jgi:class 3 adenylate cyclase/CHASE3 domain sensor protein